MPLSIRMQSLKSRAIVLWRRKRFHAVSRGSYIKCIFGPQSLKAAREHRSATHAKLHRPWSELAISAGRPMIALPGITILTSPSLQARMITPDEAVQFGNRILAEAESSGERAHWMSTLDDSFHRHVWRSLPDTVRSTLNRTMRNASLPITGAHGDLHFSNVLRNHEGEFWLIDWETYRKHGSYVEDVSRLLGTSHRSSGLPDTADPHADISNILASGAMNSAAGHLGMTIEMWLAMYIMSQATCELQRLRRADVRRQLCARVELLHSKLPLAA